MTHGFDADDYQKDVEEVEYVDECPEDDCDAALVAMTPAEMRRHIVEDHDNPLGIRYVCPTDAERKHREEQREWIKDKMRDDE